jgi:glycosyltransferase involved in cell wall biosynthesis
MENESNSGVEFTRNRGLEVMSGEYVMFLDSDDLISSDMIQDMVCVAEKSKAEVVLCTYGMLKDNKNIPILANSNIPETMSTKAFGKFLLDKLEWKILCCVGTKLYRIKIIQENQLRFDKKYKYNEDGGFILTFLLVSKKISYINKPYYTYRIRQLGSVMSSYRPNMFYSTVEVNQLLRKLFVNNGIFPDKKTLYYKKLYFIILDSLRNEAQYGSLKSFNAVVDSVVKFEEYQKMLLTLKNSGTLNTKQKCVLLCMRIHLFKLIYLLMVTAQVPWAVFS